MGKKIMIILNAIAFNRGSEALVRGLVKACKEQDKNCQIYLTSSEANFADKINIEGVTSYIEKFTYKRDSLIGFFWAGIGKAFHARKLDVKMRCKNLLKAAKESDIIFVIGADNYDKSYHMFDGLHAMNLNLKKVSKAKMVMYDCSLEKAHIDNDVIDDMKIFDAITVREPITLRNFKEVFDNNKIYYYPDPAFMMPPKEWNLPKNFKEGKTIGVNLSDLILKPSYCEDKELVLKSYYNMIDHIINNTENNVALIPHVMNGKDLSVLKLIYERYKNNDKVILIDNENLDAREVKYLISKCRMFVGARTHATIAAYSSCVPTLVLGYSVKSKGISEDLFGTVENYVLPVSSLKNENELLNNYKWLEENENSIRKHLTDKMPSYIAKAEEIKELIAKL